MLEYNEIKPRCFIIFEGEPYEVLTSHVFRKQQRKPVNQTKLRHLKTGRVVEHAFHVSDKAEEAELEKKKIKFIYQNRGQYVFSSPESPGQRFSVPLSVIGEDKAKFLKPNEVFESLLFEDEVIGLKLPVKIELKVVSAPPGVKGDTAQGGVKQATLETGAVVNVPLFVNEGENVIVNTETGDYVGRIS